MSPATPNILFAVIAIMAGVITYFACKTCFWKQYTSKLFSQLCQLADRVRYEGEKKPEGFLVRQEDVDAVMEEYPEVAASNPDIMILHKPGDTNGNQGTEGQENR